MGHNNKLTLEELLENYTVHNDGTVIKNRNGARMAAQIKKGYWAMSFCVDGKKKRMMLHRLVAIVHIPNPNNYPDINHKDCNKLNAHYTNLEWCTPQQNNEHAKANGLIKCGPRFHSKELVDAAMELFANGEPSNKVAELLDLPVSSIYKMKGTYFCCQLKSSFKAKKIVVSSKISDEIILRVMALKEKNLSVNDICSMVNITYQKVWYILNVVTKKSRYVHLKKCPEVGQVKLNLF